MVKDRVPSLECGRENFLPPNLEYLLIVILQKVWSLSCGGEREGLAKTFKFSRVIPDISVGLV
jgi:hypothetical protein